MMRLVPRRHAGVLVAVILAAGLVALLVFGVLAQRPTTSIDDHLARGRSVPAPAFSLAVLARGELPPAAFPSLARALQDGRLSLRELRGTPTVLNFWASWCAPCTEEALALSRGWHGAQSRHILFLGLNMQDVTSDARAFMKRFGVTYPTVREPTNATAQRYGATGIPETFFIDRSGRVVGHIVGVVRAGQLKAGEAAADSGRVRMASQGGARSATR